MFDIYVISASKIFNWLLEAVRLFSFYFKLYEYYQQLQLMTTNEKNLKIILKFNLLLTIWNLMNNIVRFIAQMIEITFYSQYLCFLYTSRSYQSIFGTNYKFIHFIKILQIVEHKSMILKITKTIESFKIGLVCIITIVWGCKN